MNSILNSTRIVETGQIYNFIMSSPIFSTHLQQKQVNKDTRKLFVLQQSHRVQSYFE